MASNQPVAVKSNSSECLDEACVAHEVFGIRMVEQLCCEDCGYRSAPFQSTLFTAYAYAAMLREHKQLLPPDRCSFDAILHSASKDTRPCPNRNKGTCKSMDAPVHHWLTSLPEVFTVNVIWDSAEPTVDEIRTVLDCVSIDIDLERVFALERTFRFGSRIDSSAKYRFKGMICYYGKHYNAQFYHSATKSWYLFDDATVKQVSFFQKREREREKVSLMNFFELGWR